MRGSAASMIAFYLFLLALLLAFALMLAAMVIAREWYLAATVAGVTGLVYAAVPRLFGYGRAYSIPFPVPRSLKAGALALYVTGTYLGLCLSIAVLFYLLLRFIDSTREPVSWAWTPALLALGLLAGSALQALDVIGAVERAGRQAARDDYGDDEPRRG